MLIHSPRARIWLFGAAAVLAGLLVACSGDDDAGPLTASQASAIAADALLVSGDLPDGEWDQSEAQTAIEDLLPDTGDLVDLEILPAACEALEDAIGNLPALLGDAAPLATASRSFLQTGQLFDLQNVSATTVVFEDASDAEAAAELLAEAVSTDNLESCILAAAVPASEATVQIVEFSITTPRYALEDSTALTIEIDAIALILPINLSFDLHAFQRDNVLALYVGLTVNSEDLAEEHAGLLTAFANRVTEAQE
jgi:hypothetical protein